MKKIFVLVSLCLSVSAFALDATHFTITRISAPYFIVDGNSPTAITSAYVGFEVKNNSNSATTYNGLKFTITSIGTSVSGQNYSLLSPVSGITNVGTLAPGESKVCYYYVSYPANVTPQATFNVELTNNTAGSKTQSFVIYNRSSISASAGGAATQTFSNQDIIGGLVTDDVTYVVGNVKSNDESDFQVAVSSQFDPTKVTLLGTSVIASAVPGIPVGATDSLYFITGAASNGSTITIRWVFRITGTNFTTYLLPCAGATSGSTNYKFALNTSLGSGTPVTISSNANPLTISKTANKSFYGFNTQAVFTVTISNPGIYGITLDRITDEIPAGFTFQSIDATSGVTAANSTSMPNVGATGSITFEGGVTSGPNTSYFIPAGGSIVLKYTATSPNNNAANLTTTARGYIATALIGSAQNTVSVSNTLPVTLVSFKAEKLNEQTRLNWTTSNEINSDYFEVERSAGNSGYNKIGKLMASGNSLVTNNYYFIDSFPPAGTSQYRLKLMDKDGKYEYSRVISFCYKQAGLSVSEVYNNPFSDRIELKVNSGNKQLVELQLFDMTGKLVARKNQTCYAGMNNIVIQQLESLGKGAYVLHIITATGVERLKLVKGR